MMRQSLHLPLTMDQNLRTLTRQSKTSCDLEDVLPLIRYSFGYGDA